MNQPKLILSPIRQAAPAAGGTFEVLVRVQAPDRPPEGEGATKRQPLRLAVVIDRSGSMAGQPLAEALRCAEYIGAGLQPTDQLAVVLYDNRVQVPLQLHPAGDPARVREALAGVESGGNTALFDGWQAGATILEGASGEAISRVLLLSDGQANEGLCDPQEIERHCAKWATKCVFQPIVDGVSN
jgi:Ca-activated chloride channel family protein